MKDPKDRVGSNTFRRSHSLVEVLLRPQEEEEKEEIHISLLVSARRALRGIRGGRALSSSGRNNSGHVRPFSFPGFSSC